MIETDKIAEALGGDSILGRHISSLGELSDLVQHGLPKQSISYIVKRMAPTPRKQKLFRNKIIPEATYKRRRSSLSLEESERTERLARVIATSDYIWSDKKLSTNFLTAPHPIFNNRKPSEVAYTELGARQVEDLLWQIYYGIPV
jgi:putative toxin-antitoxin system antitoxin component (TIGR02293 family)